MCAQIEHSKYGRRKKTPCILTVAQLSYAYALHVYLMANSMDPRNARAPKSSKRVINGERFASILKQAKRASRNAS